MNSKGVLRALTACILSAAVVMPGPSGAAGADQAGCGMVDGVLVHGRRDSRRIALTFDACPTRHVPPFSPSIVDFLEQERVAATFFVSGRWAEVHPDDFSQLHRVAYFEVALHGYRHRHLLGASAAAIRAEIEDGRGALLRLRAQPAPLFRPPYGDRPRELAEVARAAGVVPVLWDIEPGDPDPKETSTLIERTVVRHARGGSIVVMHVNGRAAGTPDALPGIVRRLKERGFKFVTVGELARECGLDQARSTGRPGSPQ